MGAAPSSPRPSISLPRAPGFPARRGAFGRVFEFTSHGLTRDGLLWPCLTFEPLALVDCNKKKNLWGKNLFFS